MSPEATTQLTNDQTRTGTEKDGKMDTAEMTRDEIKAALTGYGVQFNTRARTPKLTKLLEEASRSIPVNQFDEADHPDPETPEPHEELPTITPEEESIDAILQRLEGTGGVWGPPWVFLIDAIKEGNIPHIKWEPGCHSGGN